MAPARRHRTVTRDRARAEIADSEVETLAQLAIDADGSAAMAYVAAAWERGVGMEVLCLGLLAPAARRLGERWQEDRCSFLQVTLGVGRLQQALFRLAPRFPRPRRGDVGGHRALIAPAVGEQHTFGAQMTAELFRQDGWLTSGGPFRSRTELCATLRRTWFDVVGLSLATQRLLDSVAADIGAIRGASRNPQLVVLIGGRLVERHPGLVAGIGADGTAADARAAPQQARRAVARRGGDTPGRVDAP